MRNGAVKPVNGLSIHSSCQPIGASRSSRMILALFWHACSHEAQAPIRRAVHRFVTRGRNLAAMPTGSVQGLCFLLGLLMAFYLLVPFLELAVL
jgi:hypothetical protein